MPLPRANLKIELNGSFVMNWADYLGDMQVHEQIEQGTVQSTTLVGHPRDLEACLGLLHMLVDRGFPVRGFEYRQAMPGEAVVGDAPLNDDTDMALQPGAR